MSRRQAVHGGVRPSRRSLIPRVAFEMSADNVTQ